MCLQKYPVKIRLDQANSMKSKDINNSFMGLIIISTSVFPVPTKCTLGSSLIRLLHKNKTYRNVDHGWMNIYRRFFRHKELVCICWFFFSKKSEQWLSPIAFGNGCEGLVCLVAHVHVHQHQSDSLISQKYIAGKSNLRRPNRVWSSLKECTWTKLSELFSIMTYKVCFGLLELWNKKYH